MSDFGSQFPSVDLSSGAGHEPRNIHATSVVITPPTIVPNEILAELASPNSFPVSGSPSASLLNISAVPVRKWTYKSREWAMGLLGPLRKAVYVDEKGVDVFAVRFSGGGFKTAISEIFDVKHNNFSPFKYVDSSHWWKGTDIRLYAHLSSTQSGSASASSSSPLLSNTNGEEFLQVGSMEECGISSKGVQKFTLGNDCYFLKRYRGVLLGGTVSPSLLFITIFTHSKEPLIHWEGVHGKVDILTHSDVTLLLLILSNSILSYESTQELVAYTLEDLNGRSRLWDAARVLPSN